MMGFEVVAKLALRENHCIKQLLDLGVARLGIGQDFANVVHRPLDRQSVPFLRALYNDHDAGHLGSRSHLEVQRLAVSQRCKDWVVGQRRL
jgi:hypothetical protein